MKGLGRQCKMKSPFNNIEVKGRRAAEYYTRYLSKEGIEKILHSLQNCKNRTCQWRHGPSDYLCLAGLDARFAKLGNLNQKDLNGEVMRSVHDHMRAVPRTQSGSVKPEYMTRCDEYLTLQHRRICVSCFATLHTTSPRTVFRAMEYLRSLHPAVRHFNQRKNRVGLNLIRNARNYIHWLAALVGQPDPAASTMTQRQLCLPFISISHVWQFYLRQPESRGPNGAYISYETFRRHAWPREYYKCLTKNELKKCWTCSFWKQMLTSQGNSMVMMKWLMRASFAHVHEHLNKRYVVESALRVPYPLMGKMWADGADK
jgi:hypothetical protein